MTKAHGAEEPPESTDTAKVENFSEVKVGASPTGGPELSSRGPGKPAEHMRLLLAPTLSVLGLPTAVVLAVAHLPILFVISGFVVPQVMALVWWWLLRPAGQDGEATLSG